jgi:predicted  nucleic acid-binding Zn-ribbon protein
MSYCEINKNHNKIFKLTIKDIEKQKIINCIQQLENQIKKLKRKIDKLEYKLYKVNKKLKKQKLLINKSNLKTKIDFYNFIIEF